MARWFPICVLVGALGGFTAAAQAHYNMLLAPTGSAKKGEAVTLVYRWGHPFEHQLFDAPPPQSLIVLSPADRKDLVPSLEKSSEAVVDGKKATVYRFSFTPPERGDYLFLLTTPPIWMEEDQEFLQDHVRVTLHVQAQRGWDTVIGKDLEIVPLTRPYGLEPGMAFQAHAMLDGQPLAGALVEVEHYHAEPPASLPPDEHITRTVKTDRGGGLVCNVTEPGWWAITVSHDGGKREHQGKAYPVRQRATLWVYVDAKLTDH